MTILFTGGGTMGPVTPLLAVLRRIRTKKPDVRFAWAGTPDGPERSVIEAEGVHFYPVPVAKLSRHPSFSWFTWPIQYARAILVARKILNREQPDLVVSAGGFTAVPVMSMAGHWNIRCAIHQLDAEPGLSNVTVAKHCEIITTSFHYDLPPFRGKTATPVATPTRFAGIEMPSREEAAAAFDLDSTKPILFFLGGGTGAVALNQAVWDLEKELLEQTQIIHATGRGKSIGHLSRSGYVIREFLSEEKIKYAYAAADLVISRAGIGAISDLAALSKPAIFVPIPDSHQEINVMRLPVAVVEQGAGFEERLHERITSFLGDAGARETLGKKLHLAFPTDDGTALAERWIAHR
ncbi:MAG: glycosyltransferase [Patescibacteria group bacterium]|jgi:UDP-N-acetylglucosamine:LPS N-acetylglucosamine transferase